MQNKLSTRSPICRLAWFLVLGLSVSQPWAQTSRPSGAGMRPSPDVVTESAPLPETETTQLRLQFTAVAQNKGSFRAAYSGPNSLSPNFERSWSFTSTLMMGARPWAGGEVYLNPEVAAGYPLSNLTGFGGFPNGELARTSGTAPTLYLARLFLRQTWGFGGGRQGVESDQNQLGGSVDARRLVLTAGVLPVVDVFDDNAYSHDARTQFMNWSLVTHGSFDFAADSRGYSRGVALEWFDLGWAVRAGRFAMPRESNGLRLNPAIGRSQGDQVEFEHEYQLLGQAGKLRWLWWRSRAVMGGYDDALALAAINGQPPAVGDVRRDRRKRGWGINIEQPLGRWGGAFVRIGAGDDRSETYAYTEIGRSVSAGVLLSGSQWGRAEDRIGIAMARNGLSGPHRRYLAAGGLGFFLGDGALSYRPEQVIELFYSLAVHKHAWLSLNLQRVTAPGYNGDRGPVNLIGVRAHSNF